MEALTSKGMAHTVRIIGPTYRWPFSPHVLITLQGGQSVRFIPEVRSKPPGFIATTSTSIEVLLRRDDDAKVALDIQDVIDDVQVVEDPALSALFQSHGEMLMKEARRLSLLMVAVSILIAAILILPIVMYHIYSFPLTLIWLVSSMLLTGILFMRAMGRFNDFAMGIMTDRLGRYLDALP